MKKVAVFLILLLLAGCGHSGSADYNKEDYKNVAEASNRFAFDMLNELKLADKGSNLFYSPISMHLALSMTYNGADGGTRKEMADVLHVQNMELGELNKAFQSFIGVTGEKDYGVTLNIANSIWLKEGYPFLEEFKKQTEEFYHAEVQGVDFLDPETKDKINGWVEDKTNGKIKNLIENIQPDSVAFLINTIYFNGDWKTAFDEKRTYEDTFYMNNGETKQHPFMFQDGEFNYFENDLFQAVELPYKGEKASMILFLPNESKELEDFYNALSYESLNSWKTQFARNEGIVQLPKFQLEYEATLNDQLVNLGMPAAFTNQADFSKMIENGGIAISEVRHKSYIDVNEKGTEAAAATSVEMRETAAVDQFYMTLNRPFFFIIQDNESGMILFMGEVNEPELNE